MRTWPFALIGISATAAAAPTAPASFRAAMKSETCDSVKWTRISDDTWLARCDEKGKDPDDKRYDSAMHKVFVFHHTAAAKTFDKATLANWQSQHARKGGDADMSGDVEVKGTTVTTTSSSWSGETQTHVWDLTVYPPRLVTHAYGGASAWSHATAPDFPKCKVDLKRRRDTCEWDRPSCDDPKSEGWDGKQVQFREIPTLTDSSRLDIPADPFTCAGVFGDDKSDVYFGKNPKATTFEAVADEDSQKQGKFKVTLYLRAKDATPALPTANGTWQNADHWEIWLGRAGSVIVEWRDDKPGYCKSRANDYVQLIVAPHKDGTVELANGTPKTKQPITDAAAHLGKKGEVVVELTGALQEWAWRGGLTVSYSDSLDGKRQDTIIGSSHVVWGKSETFGRLGRDVCHAGKLSPTSMPWQP